MKIFDFQVEKENYHFYQNVQEYRVEGHGDEEIGDMVGEKKLKKIMKEGGEEDDLRRCNRNEEKKK